MNGTKKVWQWKGGCGHLFICQHHQAQWPTPTLSFVCVDNRKDLHVNDVMWTLDRCRGEWDHQCTMLLRMQPHETYGTGSHVVNNKDSCTPRHNCDQCKFILLMPLPLHPTNIHTILFMSYGIPGNLAAIKFSKMARNCLDNYLANLKFGDSHDQIESSTYHTNCLCVLTLSLVATRLQ